VDAVERADLRRLLDSPARARLRGEELTGMGTSVKMIDRTYGPLAGTRFIATSSRTTGDRRCTHREARRHDRRAM
jgi:hypothetical protein